MEVICVVSLFALLSSWEAEDGWKWYVHCEFVCSLVFCARPFLFIWKKRQIDLTVSKLGKQKMEVIWTAVWVCLHSCLLLWKTLFYSPRLRKKNGVPKLDSYFLSLCVYLEDFACIWKTLSFLFILTRSQIWLTVSKHGNQKMLCIVSLSALSVCSCGRSLSSPIRLASLKNFWRAEEWCRSGKREVIVS